MSRNLSCSVTADASQPQLLEQKRSELSGAPIRCFELSGPASDHGLPFETYTNTRVLMLDDNMSISSVYCPDDPGRLTGYYWDVVAGIDPVLPAEGSIAFLGFAGGTGALSVNKYWPERKMEGWELDQEVIDVVRPHLGVSTLEDKGKLRLVCGDAFEATSEDSEGFAAIFVDLFVYGALLPPLSEVEPWKKWISALRPGGRILANLGGGNEEQTKATEAAFAALAQAAGMEVSARTQGENTMVLTGPKPDSAAWEAALPEELRPLSQNWT